jgi:hypothetical protein
LVFDTAGVGAVLTAADGVDAVAGPIDTDSLFVDLIIDFSVITN